MRRASPIRTSARLAGLVLAASLSPMPADAQRRIVTTLDLGPADHGELAHLELRQGNAADTARPRRAITDLLVRVRAPSGDAQGVLAAPDGFRPGGRRPLFTLDLAVVAAGRIVLDESMACERWVADVAICHAQCDGGQIALERRDGGAYAMTFGRLPKGLAEHLEPGYRMGACSRGPDQSLGPARANSATITLTPR